MSVQKDGATSASTSISYRSYTVRTNFQCAGIVESATQTASLVDRVTLADGSYYAFSYEGTPGASDGAVTARIASILLPAGGTISYAYSGGCGGTGINADGTVANLKRTTSDGTRSYTRATVNSNATNTTVQDEKSNQTLYRFTNVAGLFYETHRQAYQGNTRLDVSPKHMGLVVLEKQAATWASLLKVLSPLSLPVHRWDRLLSLSTLVAFLGCQGTSPPRLVVQVRERHCV